MLYFIFMKKLYYKITLFLIIVTFKKYLIQFKKEDNVYFFLSS